VNLVHEVLPRKKNRNDRSHVFSENFIIKCNNRPPGPLYWYRK